MKVAALAMLGLGGLCMTGCASTSIHRLSGDEFVARADQVSQINSFHWATFVGGSYRRAYLEYQHPAFIGNGVRTKLYWTLMSELPAGLIDDLEEKEAPEAQTEGPHKDRKEKI